MGIPLRHLGVGVAEDLLHLIQGASGVDQERRIHVAQVVDAEERQPD